jgi:6-phosphogluconolactonase (cycloisomerase 2 family)
MVKSINGLRRLGAALAGLVAAGFLSAGARAEPCGAPRSAVVEVPLSGKPFAAVADNSGCTIYVSLRSGRGGAIAVYRRDGDGVTKVAESSVADPAFGLTLTHDGALLIVAEGNGITFFDTAALLADSGSARLGHIDDGGKGAIEVAVTADDRLLFVSDEHSGSIGVIDLGKARATGFANESIIGRIPVAVAPVGLALSPRGILFATVQIVPWPNRARSCQPEGDRGGMHYEGAVVAIDVERARADPAKAVIGFAPAGCNPVRVALSPASDRAYVTMRGSNALAVFDTAKLASGAQDSEVATVAVGTAPVGIVVAADGAKVIVTDSDRFGAGKNERQTLSVIDTGKIGTDAAVLGVVDVGAFPRELSLTPDGRTLLVANANSESLMLIDLDAMPIRPIR